MGGRVHDSVHVAPRQIATALPGRGRTVRAPSGGRPALSAGVLTLSGLYVYPIKSCGGITLDNAALSATGLRYDRRSDEGVRLVDSLYAEDGDQVGFADGFSFLLISEASLDGLNRRLEEPVLMNRFRPNLVVGGCEP